MGVFVMLVSLVLLIEGDMVSEPSRCGRISRVVLGYLWFMDWGEGWILSGMCERTHPLCRVRCGFLIPYFMY